MQKKKIRLKISTRAADHLINAILIFASVFLAFWMNEIRIENKEIELTNDAKRSILAEWKINLVILERSFAYHKDILEKGKEPILTNIDTISLFNMKFIPGFDNRVQKETITNNSKGLVTDQQINFDLKSRLTINQINEQQKYLTRAADALSIDFLNQRELLDKTKVKENYLLFFALLEKLVEQEKIMIERIKFVINEFEQ